MVSEIWNPKIVPIIFPQFLSDPFHIFRDGKLLKVFQFSSKFSPHLLPVFHTKIGKSVRNFGSKMGAINSLAKSAKSMQLVKITVI